MKWPPVKAWTSKQTILGYKHFVAINYGGSYKKRWVNLVSVLNGSAVIKTSWTELCNSSLWIPGWVHFDKDEKKNYLDKSNFQSYKDKETKSCLHPSKDSGFSLPCEIDSIRPWF